MTLSRMKGHHSHAIPFRASQPNLLSRCFSSCHKNVCSSRWSQTPRHRAGHTLPLAMDGVGAPPSSATSHSLGGAFWGSPQINPKPVSAGLLPSCHHPSCPCSLSAQLLNLCNPHSAHCFNGNEAAMKTFSKTQYIVGPQEFCFTSPVPSSL